MKHTAHSTQHTVALTRRTTLRDERGQAVIEFTLALLVVALLFGGTVAVWTWMNRSLIWRQRRYDDTRTWDTDVDTNAGTLPGLDYYPPEPLVE